MKYNVNLACVGIGMTLGSHLTPSARFYIENADVVFAAVSTGVVESWLQELNSNVISLQSYYKEGKSRLDTYKEMVNAILDEVRGGKMVCGAFYGHPGVFAWAPHKAIELARQEGYVGKMEPGISAADTLYADLLLDPGRYGCKHIEASQFLFFKSKIDLSSYLILWQVGVVGDRSLTEFSVDQSKLNVLVEELLTLYGSTHEVILYEASLLPTENPRIERIQLQQLVEANISLHTTLVIPPAIKKVENKIILDKLKQVAR